jgi:hypothetical protein
MPGSGFGGLLLQHNGGANTSQALSLKTVDHTEWPQKAAKSPGFMV